MCRHRPRPRSRLTIIPVATRVYELSFRAVPNRADHREEFLAARTFEENRRAGPCQAPAETGETSRVSQQEVRPTRTLAERRLAGEVAAARFRWPRWRWKR